VRLHTTGVSSIIEIEKCDSKVPPLAANGFSGLVVHEEIHLFGSDLFKLIFKGVYSFDVDCTVWQTVPAIQHTDREEVKSCTACTVSFNQFHLWPRVYLQSQLAESKSAMELMTSLVPS